MQPLTPSPQQPGPLDQVVFHGLKDLFDENLLSETYCAFLSQCRERLQGLRAPSEEEAFRNIGHSLRGSAGMLGASQLARLATLLEHLSPGSEGMLEALDALDSACDTLEQALRQQGVRLG